MGALVDLGDVKYDAFLSYRVWCEGSDAPGNGYCPRIFDALSSAEITVQGGRSKRAIVYLDKVRLIDGQSFDKVRTQPYSVQPCISPVTERTHTSSRSV